MLRFIHSMDPMMALLANSASEDDHAEDDRRAKSRIDGASGLISAASRYNKCEDGQTRNAALHRSLLNRTHRSITTSLEGPCRDAGPSLKRTTKWN